MPSMSANEAAVRVPQQPHEVSTLQALCSGQLAVCSATCMHARAQSSRSIHEVSALERTTPTVAHRSTACKGPSRAGITDSYA